MNKDISPSFYTNKEFNRKNYYIYFFNRESSIYQLRDRIIKNNVYFDYLVCSDARKIKNNIPNSFIYDNNFNLIYSCTSWGYNRALDKYFESYEYKQRLRYKKLNRLIFN